MRLSSAKSGYGTALSVEGLFDSLLCRINNRLGDTGEDFAKFRHDPVGFGEKVLGESYTVDVKALMASVRDNPITVAQSANAVGKTHAAARIAAWFFKCFAGSQVYSTSAPPEGNLKRLLWGEIGGIVDRHPELFKNRRSKASGDCPQRSEFSCGCEHPDFRD